MNWKLQEGQQAPYAVKEDDLGLKREMWETAKTAGKWYVGANLVVLVAFILPIAFATIAGLIWLFTGIVHEAAATQAAFSGIGR